MRCRRGLLGNRQRDTFVYPNLRALGDKGGPGRPLEESRVLRAVDGRGIDVDLDLSCAPDAPSRMLDAVLARRAVPMGRVAPVVLGDEGLFRAREGDVRFAVDSRPQPVPPAADAPLIGDVTAFVSG